MPFSYLQGGVEYLFGDDDILTIIPGARAISLPAPATVRRICGHTSRHGIFSAAAGLTEGNTVKDSLLIAPKQWLVMGMHIGTSKTKSEMSLRVLQCCIVISLKGVKYLPYLNDKLGVEAAAVGLQYVLIKQMQHSIDRSNPLYISLANNPHFKWANLPLPSDNCYDGSGFISPYHVYKNNKYKYFVAKGAIIICINGILYVFTIIITAKGIYKLLKFTTPKILSVLKSKNKNKEPYRFSKYGAF